jgi:hypothetical protein
MVMKEEESGQSQYLRIRPYLQIIHAGNHYNEGTPGTHDTEQGIVWWRGFVVSNPGANNGVNGSNELGEVASSNVRVARSADRFRRLDAQ